jgi:predicted nucleic acid-binding protein
VEHGSEDVRAHACTVRSLHSAVHARAEFASACHRKIREGHGTNQQLKAMLDQLQFDCRAGAIKFLPLNGLVLERVEAHYLSAPPGILLRAFDALHLACAAEHGFEEVYSNDLRFLAAAPLFGMKGINVIGNVKQ